MVSAASTETHALATAGEETPRAMPRGRLGPRWLNHIKALFGTPSRRRLAQAALRIHQTRYWEKEFESLSDAELKQTGMRLRGRARGGESLDR